MRTVRRCGTGALMIDCVDTADALRVWRHLDRERPPGVTEVVPGAATVLLIGRGDDQLRLALTTIDGRTDASPPTGPAEVERGALVEIGVRYDGADLEWVAAATNLDVPEVVRRHSDAEYTVAFAGFAPGFAYLTGLDAALVLPRRSTPRPRVARGSVAIADCYSGVYPTESPGGWHLLGTTDTLLFDAGSDPPALLGPGLRVRFRRVQ